MLPTLSMAEGPQLVNLINQLILFSLSLSQMQKQGAQQLTFMPAGSVFLGRFALAHIESASACQGKVGARQFPTEIIVYYRGVLTLPSPILRSLCNFPELTKFQIKERFIFYDLFLFVQFSDILQGRIFTLRTFGSFGLLVVSDILQQDFLTSDFPRSDYLRSDNLRSAKKTRVLWTCNANVIYRRTCNIISQHSSLRLFSTSYLKIDQADGRTWISSFHLFSFSQQCPGPLSYCALIINLLYFPPD